LWRVDVLELRGCDIALAARVVDDLACGLQRRLERLLAGHVVDVLVDEGAIGDVQPRPVDVGGPRRARRRRARAARARHRDRRAREDRKSTRLNSSHEWISYAVFCLKKK